jgi:copper transport protein
VQNNFRTRLLALVATLLALILTPALLFSHALLVRSSPAAESHLAATPTSLDLWFSERPELTLTTLELSDSAGVPMALEPLAAIPGNPPGVQAAISGELANGKYTVAWHTAASDGHATSGRFSFVLDAPQSAAAPAVPSASIVIHSGRRANPILTSSDVVMSTGSRWAELVALLTLVGSVVYRLFILQDAALPSAITADSADRARRLALGAVLLFLVATLTRAVSESNLVGAASTGRFNAVVTVVRDTGWGHGWMIGLVGALVMLAGLAAGRGSYVGWVIAGLGVAAVATSEALTGHAGASLHRLPLAVAVDVAHVLGAGGWLGGLTAVMFCGMPALRGVSDDERPRVGSSLVRAYHRAAVDSVTVVVLTALVAAWLRLGTISELWTSAYGNMLLRKIFFVVILLGFGLYHWRTSVKADWDADSKFRFQRTVAFELVIGAVVVAFTALLIGMNPPTH